MKKVYLLFGLLLSLLLVGVVKAEGPYYQDFSIRTGDTMNAVATLPYKDGYLFVDIGVDNELVLSTRNIKGEVIKEKELEPAEFKYALTEGNNIYLLVRAGDEYYLNLLHDKLEITKTAMLGTTQLIYYNNVEEFMFIYNDKL